MERVIPYDREVLKQIVIYHYKRDIKGCVCGWAELGRCHSDHIADLYEESVCAKQ